ncbi:hypothetical protein GGQ75_004549, partial [Aureimonas phyllosphaerae]|nr:hypothetical protein [Aureimonas phyllosphaerae]
SSGLCFFCPILVSSSGSKAYFTEGHFSGGRPWRMLADAMLDNAALKDLLGKKW